MLAGAPLGAFPLAGPSEAAEPPTIQLPTNAAITGHTTTSAITPLTTTAVIDARA